MLFYFWIVKGYKPFPCNRVNTWNQLTKGRAGVNSKQIEFKWGLAGEEVASWNLC